MISFVAKVPIYHYRGISLILNSFGSVVSCEEFFKEREIKNLAENIVYSCVADSPNQLRKRILPMKEAKMDLWKIVYRKLAYAETDGNLYSGSKAMVSLCSNIYMIAKDGINDDMASSLVKIHS